MSLTQQFGYNSHYHNGDHRINLLHNSLNLHNNLKKIATFDPIKSNTQKVRASISESKGVQATTLKQKKDNPYPAETPLCFWAVL